MKMSMLKFSKFNMYKLIHSKPSGYARGGYMKFFHHNKQNNRRKRRHNRNVYLPFSKKGDGEDNLAK
nr:MAG TPA: hypothetical protein [Caudoviricetes sp.]